MHLVIEFGAMAFRCFLLITWSGMYLVTGYALMAVISSNPSAAFKADYATNDEPSET